MDKDWSKLYNFITKSRQIVLSTHMSPDLDGLGSEVAFYYYLQKLDKKCRIINISTSSSRVNNTSKRARQSTTNIGVEDSVNHI